MSTSRNCTFCLEIVGLSETIRKESHPLSRKRKQLFIFSRITVEELILHYLFILD